MKKHMANAVTIAGIILAAWVNMLVWGRYENYGLILTLSLGVALTDKIDGWLARKHQIITGVGISLDKFRDKLFICPLFGFFLMDIWGGSGLVAGFIKAMIALILGVETGLILTWIYGFFKGLDVSAHRAGKIKMAIYFVVACLMILIRFLKSQGIFVAGPYADLIMAGLLLPAAIYAIKSLAGYLERYSSPKA